MFISEEPASVTGPSHNKRAQVSEELVATAAERCVTHEKCLSFNVTGALITTIEIKSFFSPLALVFPNYDSRDRPLFEKFTFGLCHAAGVGGAFFPRRNQM